MDPAAIVTADALDVPTLAELRIADHGVKFLHVKLTVALCQSHHELFTLIVVEHFLALGIGFLSFGIPIAVAASSGGSLARRGSDWGWS